MNRPSPLSAVPAAGQSLPANEALSALVDGELADDAWAADTLTAMWQDGGQAVGATWAAYQVIGDSLRAGAALPANTDRVAGVMARIRAERELGQSLPALPLNDARPMPMTHPAANDEVFRWKMLAGFAALAAAAAVTWNVTMAPAATGPQLAQAPVVPAPAATLALADSATPPPVAVSGQQGAILRDPRLEELMAAHRQAGGMSALQMPAGFLRNATFEMPGGER